MKILVTGANGYLGQGIVKAILNKGHEVIAADFKTNYVDNRADRVDCNLFEIEKPYEYFGKPDVLLHLAWRDGFVHYADSHIADLPRHYDFIKTMAESGVIDHPTLAEKKAKKALYVRDFLNSDVICQQWINEIEGAL